MAQLLIGIFFIASAAVLAFYGTQMARDGWTKVFPTKTSNSELVALRPYVIFTSTILVRPPNLSQPIQVVFYLKNTGQSEAVGSLRDFTYYFSVNPEQREFPYQHSEAVSFSLAPSEQWSTHYSPQFVLSDEKLEALNAGRARLFIYARGKYKDASGRVYNLPFARMYHPSVAGHLAIPPDDILFK